MEIVGIQIASVAFSLFMSYISYLYYKRNYFNLGTLIMWIAILLFFTGLTIFPHFLTPFAEALKFARLFDLFVVFGMVLLLSLAYKNFIALQVLKKKLEAVVQDKALEDSEE